MTDSEMIRQTSDRTMTLAAFVVFPLRRWRARRMANVRMSSCCWRMTWATGTLPATTVP